MAQPTLDEIASMSESDFANFAASFDPSQYDEGQDTSDEADDEVADDTDVDDATDADDDDSKESDDSDVDNEDAEIDAEAFFKALTAPMKAAGKEFSFTDPEEIRTLIQKGIGFEKRMGQLGKYQRHMEALDKAELLNDDTLNLIIDLAHGKPEALKQYIENNGIDVYDIIGLDAGAYKPEKHVTSQEEYEQSQVVQEIKSLEGYELVQSLAETEWDEDSRSKMLASPALVANMIQAVKAGVHDMVVKEAEKVKLLASSPMTDLEAYIAAGNKLHEKGAFDKISKKNSNVNETIQPKNVSSHSKSSKRKAGTKTIKDLTKMTTAELQAFAAENNL